MQQDPTRRGRNSLLAPDLAIDLAIDLATGLATDSATTATCSVILPAAALLIAFSLKLDLFQISMYI